MASKPTRARKWSCTRHYGYDALGCAERGEPVPTEEEWKEQIRKQFSPDKQHAISVTIMFHGMDVEDDGNGHIVPKPLHVHIVIHYMEAIYESTAINRTGVTRTENISSITSKVNLVKAYRYLTHSTERAIRERKYEYDVSDVEVYVHDGYEFSYRDARYGKIPDEDKLESEREREAQLYYTQQVVDGLMTVDEVHEHGYINDEMKVNFDDLIWKKHRAGYEQDRIDYMRRVAKAYAKPGVHRSLSTIFIQGEQQAGKTELAEALAQHWAEGKSFHSVAAHGEGKTFDFAGNYDGEDVTIVNELSPSYRPEEFCNIFDPIHAASVNSRHNDKPWYANYCINTTSMHPEEFLWHIYLPFAKARIPVGDKELHGDREWQKHYESVETVASKISEMRRRWNLWVVIKDFYENVLYPEKYPNGKQTKKLAKGAMIYIRTDKCNPNHCYYLPVDQDTLHDEIIDGNGPWVEYKVLPYNAPDEVDAVVTAIDEALHLYYEINQYSVTPWNTPKPDFAKLRLAKPDGEAGSGVAGEPGSGSHICDDEGNEA